MPAHPCTPEAGAATDPADAPVDGHGHQFGRGVVSILAGPCIRVRGEALRGHRLGR